MSLKYETPSQSAFHFREDFLRTYDLTSGNAFSRIISCYRSPGLHAIGIYRFGRWLRKKNLLLKILLEPVYLILFHRIRSKWGIEIPRSAEIDVGFYIGHYGGITISSFARIGKNVSISQQVTIGEAGRGDSRGVPIIGDDVYIAPGAKIFGKICVGNNVKIGANAVVHKDIPDNAIVVLDPGFKIISFRGNCETKRDVSSKNENSSKLA
ncbi:MAG: serine acetyltransferase [Nitrospira sp.]